MSGQTEPSKNQLDKDFESFRDFFETQFQEGDNPSSVDTVKPVNTKKYYPPSELPVWFFRDWKDYGEQNVGLGISDPGMDSIKGFNQALSRALAMIALSAYCQIENVLDNYYLDKEKSKTLGKFNSFTSIITQLSFQHENINILQQHNNSNRETILLIALTESSATSNNCDKVKLLIENFESELTRAKKPVVIGKSKAFLHHEHCSGEKELFNWQKSYSPNAAEIESGTDSSGLVRIDNSFSYYLPAGLDSIPISIPYPQYFTLKYGLWNAWQGAIISHLEQLEIFDSQIKNLDEQTTSEFQGLIRVIFSGEGAFNIRQATVKNNELLLEFE